MMNYAAIDDIRNYTKRVINTEIDNAFHKGYDQGYNDCRVELLDDEAKCEKSHKAWIPKQDAPESNVDTIEVGDEIKVVKNTCKYGEIGVVTFVRENSIDALTTRGYISTRTGNVVKTGRRFVIQAILDEMKSHERVCEDQKKTL